MDDQQVPDFSNSADVVNNAVITNPTPDFSNASDAPPPPRKLSPISTFLRVLTRGGGIEKLNTEAFAYGYMKEHGNDVGLDQALNKREEDIISQGVGRQLDIPLTFAMLPLAAAKPIQLAVGLAGAAIKDHFFNARRMIEEKAPQTAPVVKDMAEIADFAATAGVLGKATGLYDDAAAAVKNRMRDLNLPGNVDVPAENVAKINDSTNLLPEEKIDMMQTIGAEPHHIDASVNSGLPLNIPTDALIDLTQKPYWDRAKADILGETSKPVEMTNEDLVSNLVGAAASKDISPTTMARLRNFAQIDNIKSATHEQLQKINDLVGDLHAGDKFLSEKQTAALDEVLSDFKVPEVTPKRVILEQIGEKDDILDKGIMSKVTPEIVPTVDIKQGHPLVTKIVDKARGLMDHADQEISRRNKAFDKMITAAEKSRVKFLTPQEQFKRSLYPRNPEIFEAMGGGKIALTKEEAGVVAYLKNFFNKAKTDLALEKYRKNYITHMEKPLTEKILSDGLFPAIKEMLAGQKPNDLPVDLMLELENIIGSEKFFKYAMERKGGMNPTTNLRRIVNGYSSLYETKMALDKILPEGQAITQTLLKGKSAVWMKKYLQNLKGRGLDNQFKTGPMAWLAKVADGIVDVGYIKMLGFNYLSAIKNVVAGEANNWIYTDFPMYLKGKQRFVSDPKKAYSMAKEFGILDGTYADYAQKGIGSLKKLQDLSMIGQRAGEVEVRGTLMTSLLTDAEWKSGEISPDRVNQIKDAVAMTQGIFSKVDTPLLMQTWYGRMFFQMNRWRITNAMLMRHIVAEAAPDISAGKYNTQAVTRLGKMVVAYGTGMYISYQLYQAGYKKAGDVAKNIAQTVDGVTSLFTDGDMMKMFTDNPTLHMLKETSNSIQNLAVYLHVPGAKKTKEKGVTDTYVAPVQTAEEIMGSIGQ